MWTAAFRYSFRKMKAATHGIAGWTQVACGLFHNRCHSVRAAVKYLYYHPRGFITTLTMKL